MQPDRISVIIPCYKQAHYLAICIESVLATKDPNIEIIVVNDGSPDNTADVARNFLPHIKYIEQSNQGLSAARNTGTRHATGDLLHFLDSDDFIRPGLFERARAAFRLHSEAVVIYCGSIDVDQCGSVIRKRPIPPQPDDPFHTLLCGNPWPCHSIVVRKAAVVTAGLFDTSLQSCEDWDLWLRLAASGGKFVGVEGYFALYRNYSGSLSKNHYVMYQMALKVLKHNAAHHNNCHTCHAALKQGFELVWIAWGMPEIRKCLEEHQLGQYLQRILQFSRSHPRHALECAWELRHRKRWMLKCLLKHSQVVRQT